MSLALIIGGAVELCELAYSLWATDMPCGWFGDNGDGYADAL
jgi:hypothetical protein